MAEYAHPESLVTTDWVAEHGSDDNVRLVEVDVDTSSYDAGHIEGAVGWNWHSQLQQTLSRDLVSKEGMESLLGSAGIDNNTTVILYGDNNNWFAAWAFWQLKIYGHEDVRIMNGGRKKWLEEGRSMSTDTPTPSTTSYQASAADNSLRPFLGEVKSATKATAVELVDVRSPAEFSGELLSPPGLPETCQRGGHIPGASNITWAKACNDDGTFKSHDDLQTLYTTAGITGTKPIIAYCRIGERSSHSWFVLKYLLGHSNVSNYDGSWTEYGNLIAAPIER